jgi:hypothetical protein
MVRLSLWLCNVAPKSLFATFDGEFSGRSQSYAGRGEIKVSW